jgi:hypothetical protein
VTRTFLSRGGRTVALLAAVGILVVGVATPAHARGVDDVETHCIVFDDDGTIVCAPTLEEADAEFTAETGYVRDGSVAARGDVGLLVTYSLATFYRDNLYGGSSTTITRSYDCDGLSQTGYTDLSLIGMNNTISSFITYRSCQARLWDGTGYTGSSFGYTTTQASLPFFNDLASSVRAR